MNRNLLATHPRAKFLLTEVVDVGQLSVLRHLERYGIKPEDIDVVYDPGGYTGSTAASYPQLQAISIGPRGLMLPDEDLYVVLAHELTHLIHEPPKGFEMFKTAEGKKTSVHARSREEQEAIFWEATQAAKFGWDRERYDKFVRVLYSGLPISGKAIELRERPWAARPVLSRRPVRVHRHRRRRHG